MRNGGEKSEIVVLPPHQKSRLEHAIAAEMPSTQSIAFNSAKKDPAREKHRL
ncbi:MAG: hypothetical protein HC820_03955 [Hydrococcus sp. RM1_1_31]|nr:hypothetical protein [Hydrococcus sp. RM1_1_31]